MRAALMGLIACVLAGCSTADVLVSKVLDAALTQDPTIVEATVEAAPDVNPDPFGRASPIWVKVFVLDSVGVFESQDYFTLRRKSDEVLSAHVKDSDEKSLRPGGTTLMVLFVEPENQPKEKYHVAVMAGYRNLERASWRATMPIPTGETIPVRVRLDELEVSIERSED